MSPYGRMQVEDVRAKASIQLGDKTAFATSKDYALAHVDDAPDTAVRILLYANDLDGAAVALIRRQPDETIIKIVAGWARDFDPARAKSLGFRADANFSSIINAYIEDELKT